jgi:hypothetical protein
MSSTQIVVRQGFRGHFGECMFHHHVIGRFRAVTAVTLMPPSADMAEKT